MFFVPFLIMFREGLEAALIVVLIAAYLKKSGQGQWMKTVWLGAFLAAAMCFGLGIFIHRTSGEFPQQQQELFEGIVALIAVVMLTYMVFWMQRAGKDVGAHLRRSVDRAVQRGVGQGPALVLMVFLAVAREGLESVFFLVAAFTQDVGAEAPAGAVTGLLAAAAVGALLYSGSVRLPLGRFFYWSSLFILFVAAGLAAGAIRAFHEAGLWNYLQGMAFNASGILSVHSLPGTVLEGLLGYQEAPSWSEVSAYLIYLIPALAWFLSRSSRPAAGVQPS